MRRKEQRLQEQDETDFLFPGLQGAGQFSE